MSLQKVKIIIVAGISAFLLMGFWVLYSMPMDERGKMADCPFTNGSASLCQMRATEHIAQWQQLFTTTPGKNLLSSALALLVALLAVLFPVIPRARNKLLLQKFRNYFYKHKPEIKLFHHLLLAFSQGILHPRIYA